MNIGDKFYSWTVIDNTIIRDKYSNIKYKCQCDCGKISYLYKDKLKGLNTKSCRSCSTRKTNIPKINEKIGNWTILDNTPIKTKYGNRFKAQCKCSHIDNILYFRVLKNPTNCCSKCKLTGRPRSTDKQILSCRLYANYKSSAKKRNLQFNLTRDEIYDLCTKKCHYCGSEHSNIYISKRKKSNTFKYNGIDRVDNSKGYTITNCVTCCKTCNSAKSNMTTDNFLEWINKLITHHQNQSQ